MRKMRNFNTFAIIFGLLAAVVYAQAQQQHSNSSTTLKRPALDDGSVDDELMIPTTTEGVLSQQTRKGLNELPEMKKAKELRTESEKAEIEASRMEELSKIEAELRRKEEPFGDEAETSGISTLLPGNERNPSTPTNSTKNKFGDEKKVESGGGNKKPFHSTEGMHQVEPSTAGEEEPEVMGGEEGTAEMTSKNTTNEKFDEKKGEESDGKEEGGRGGGEGHLQTSKVPFEHEALVTTPRATTTPAPRLEASGDEEGAGGIEDPFQSSSTEPSRSTKATISSEGGGEPAEESSLRQETIKETVHVHTPQLKMKSEEVGGGSEGTGTTHSTEPAPQEKESEVTSNSKEEGKHPQKGVEEEVEEAKQVDAEEGVQQHREDEKKSTVSFLGSQSAELPPSGNIEGAHPIVFPAPTHTTSTTTEETAIMVGDKSLFEQEGEKLPEPGKAQIHHMLSGENEKEDEEKAETSSSSSSTTQPEQQQPGIGGLFRPSGSFPTSSFINSGNTGGFVVPSKPNEGEHQAEEEEEDGEEQQRNPTTLIPENGEGRLLSAPEKSAGGDEHADVGAESVGLVTATEKQSDSTPTVNTTTAAASTDRIAITQEIPFGGIIQTGLGIHNEEDGEESAQEEKAKDGENITSPITKMPLLPTNDGEKEAKKDEEGVPSKPEEDISSLLETTPKRVDSSGAETTILPISIKEHDKMRAGGEEDEGEFTMVEKPHQPNKNISEDREGEHSKNELLHHQEEEAMDTTLNPGQLEQAKSRAFHTSFSIRFPDIEWRPEFAELSSGASKKLLEQILGDLRLVFSTALGVSNTLLDVHVMALSKGSVLVEGEMLTADEVNEPQIIATALEQAILAKGGELGGNQVDTEQLTVGGHLPDGGGSSSNSVSSSSSSSGQQQQKRQEEGENATNTGLIIGGAVIVGVLVIVFAVFAIVVFGLNNRRNSHGSMKFTGGVGKHREEISMVENGNGFVGTPRRFVPANDIVGGGGVGGMDGSPHGGVSLTALRSTNGAGVNANGTPILLNGSQFSSNGRHY